MRSWLCATAFAGLTTMTPVDAEAAQPPSSSPALSAITACRAIGEAAVRLSCFDRESAALATAIAARDVYLVDKAEVKRTRTSLFGLSLPRGSLFDAGGTAVEQVDSTVTRSVTGTDNNAVLTLANGQVWQQLDGRMFGRDPRAGMKVTIKRGTLGRYDLSVEGGPPRQVRRAQ